MQAAETCWNDLVSAAQAGDRPALEALTRAIQGRIYTLSLRFLANPEDARDATQEILIILITRLSTFDGHSAFPTWAYRVAVNYLLRAKKMRARTVTLPQEAFETDLHSGLEDPAPGAEDRVLLNELRIACTMAMLLCLDVEHRIAFVLGEILELEHREAAEVLEIAPTTYRKRLSRARAEIVAFSGRICGLANARAKCSCPRRLAAARQLGRIDPAAPLNYAAGGVAYETVLARTRAMERDLAALCLQKSPALLACPDDLAETVRSIVADHTAH